MNNVENMRMRYIFFAMVVLWLVLLSPASATDYYVNNSWSGASDSNTGLADTNAAAWRTVQKAAQTMVAGDTVYVGAGIYYEHVDGLNSGNATAGYITYTGLPGAIINASNQTNSSATRTTINFQEKSWIIFENFTVVGLAGQHVIGAGLNFSNQVCTQHSHNITIRNNYVYNPNYTDWGGINIGACGGGSNNYDILIENNTVDNTGNTLRTDGVAETISLSDVYNGRVLNNTIINNTAIGIDLKGGGHNITVLGNTVLNPGCQGIYLDGYAANGETISDIYIINNRVKNAGGVGQSYHTYDGKSSIVLASEMNHNLTFDNIYVFNNIVEYGDGAAFVIGGGPGWFEINTYSNISLYSNTVVHSRNSCFSTGNSSSINRDWNVYNNICAYNNNLTGGLSGDGYLFWGGANVTNLNMHSNHYLNYNSTIGNFGSNYTLGNPNFTNATDYHLQNTSSNLTANTTLVPSYDYDWRVRPQGDTYEKGAYEYYAGEPEAPGEPASTEGYSFCFSGCNATWVGNSTSDGTLLHNDGNIWIADKLMDYVFYGDFEEPSGDTLNDLSANENNGTLNNNTNWQIPGLLLNGIDDRVTIPNSSSTFLSNGISFTAKLKNDSLTANSVIVSKYDTTPTGRGWRMHLNTNGSPIVAFGSSDCGATGESVTDNSHKLNGSSTNLGFGWSNPGNITIYQDGAESTSYSTRITKSTSLCGSSRDIWLGAYRAADLSPFPGTFYRAKLFNRNLSAAEWVTEHTKPFNSSGNRTIFYNWTDGNVTGNITVNVTTPANTNYSVYYRENATGTYALLASNQTGNNTVAISSTKYQNTDIIIQLFGNETTTPELMKITLLADEPEAPVVSNRVDFSFSNISLSETQIYQSSQATVVSVDINDSDGYISSAIVGITYLGVEFNYSMTGGNDTWTYSFKSGVPGTYTLTHIYATDNASGTNSTTSSLQFVVVPVTSSGSSSGSSAPIQVTSQESQPSVLQAAPKSLADDINRLGSDLANLPDEMRWSLYILGFLGLAYYGGSKKRYK